MQKKNKGGRPRKGNSVYDAYTKDIGEHLLSLATKPGNPISATKAKFKLFSNQIENWLGKNNNEIYYNSHFTECYDTYCDLRRDWLDKMVITGKLDNKVWVNISWSQLKHKVQPPKEIQSSSEISGTMRIEDMHHIIEVLESKKNSCGF